MGRKRTFQTREKQAKRNPPKRVPDAGLINAFYEAFLRCIQPSSPSAEPNSQTAAGTGTT